MTTETYDWNGIVALSRNGLRYSIPPYGIQADAGAGLAVSYASKEKKPASAG